MVGFVSPPTFDDYVARGRHLLRTAWLLMGDPQKAELNKEALEFENVHLAVRSYK